MYFSFGFKCWFLPDFPVFFVLIFDPDSADFPVHRHVLSISRKKRFK